MLQESKDFASVLLIADDQSTSAQKYSLSELKYGFYELSQYSFH